MAIEKIKKDVQAEKPNFGIKFQMGVIKLCLTDDYFATKTVKYLANDKDLDEYTIFDNKHLQTIFKLIAQSMMKYKVRPTEGQLRQSFNDYEENTREDLNEILDKIIEEDTSNDSYYRDYMKTYITQVKMAKGFKKTQKIWVEHPDNAPEVMQSVIDDIRRISFESDDVVSFSDLDHFLLDTATINGRKIPTGIKELDKDLVGGLPRQCLTVVLAGSNVGKSIFAISLGVQALLAVDENGVNRNLKVLQINLEGMREEALMRYTANLAKVDLDKLLTKTYNAAEAQRIEDVKKNYDDRLMIRNMLGFGATIEDLIAYCREVHKDYKFDMLIVDYGQLLETKAKTEGVRHTMARVFRGLDSIGKELDCVVITPAQATRNSQEKQTEFIKRKEDKAPVLRMTDISEAMEISRVAAVIMTLNLTPEEAEKGLLRLFLEKQRQGAKNKLYGLVTNYAQSNLITGKTYNPYSTVITEQNSRADEKTMSLKDFDLPKPKEILKKDTTLSLYDNNMQKYLHEQAKSFIEAIDQYKLCYSKYDEERNADDGDIDIISKLSDQIEIYEQNLKEFNTEIKLNFLQGFKHLPKYSADFIDSIKNAIKTEKAKKPNEQNKLIIEKNEMMLLIFEIYYDIRKIPTIRV